MRRRPAAIHLATVLGVAGLSLATALVAFEGVGTIIAALAGAGLGLVWASLFHIVPMVLNARAWQVLMPGARPPTIGFFGWAVWVRESVNGLLPVARIGGEVVSVRLLLKHGVRKAPAVAAIVVDMTLTVATEFLFTILGLLLLLGRTGDLQSIASIAIGVLVTVPLLAAMVLVQRFGLFEFLARVVRKLFGSRFDNLISGAVPLDRALRILYRRRGRILRGLVWQFAASIVGVGEIWLALYFLGHPIGFADALILGAVAGAISSAAFVVPGAIGVQEGGFILVGSLVGLPAEIALALALARRARDLIIYVPGLLAWQLAEGRRLFFSRG